MSTENKGTSKLLYLKRNYEQLARQGSKSWYTGRRTRFGGSEIGKVINNKEKIIIKNKRNIRYDMNLYCSWGHNFEIVAKVWLEYSKKIKIHDFGSVPSTRLPMAYSPDGVYVNPEDEDLWLLEIKCPFMRNVTADTKILPDYMAQIQSGMAILPCDFTNFVQFKFRRCYENQLNKPGQFDKYLHKDFRRKKDESPCMWFGALYWEGEDGICQNIILDTPTKIYYSFKDNVIEEIDKYLTGCYMYFKCFYVQEQTVKRDFNFELWNQGHIWDSYSKLMNDYYEQKEIKEKSK